MPKKCVSFKAQLDAETRTEEFLGQEHLVVPLVALVEGVLQGMTSPTPELALAEEFGKVPQGWDGRPVVMNHPVVNNMPVSANSPAVLEDYSFGQLFNTHVDGDKLKTEAWINLARVEELGGEIATTVERIQNNEDVEISTGLFAATEQSTGKFNDRDYSAIWRDIVPDHLAILSEGKKGACSIEDGCGVRNNADKKVTAHWQEFKTVDCGCGCGGKCQGNKVNQDQDQDKPKFESMRFFGNAIPDGMIDRDIWVLLQAAINELNSGYNYVIGFTTEKMVYETFENSDFVTLQRTYDISADNVVTLGNDIEQVVLLTKIAPVQEVQTSNSNSSTQLNNEESTTMPDDKKQEKTATQEVVGNEKTETKNQSNSNKDNGQQQSQESHDQDNGQQQVQANAEPKKEDSPKPKTMQQYLDDMPAEMREVMSSGMKLHNEKRAGLIKNLQDSGRCKFSEDELKAMSLDTLENMAELANVPRYDGTAVPKDNSELVDNQDTIPEPPKLFEKSSNDNKNAA